MKALLLGLMLVPSVAAAEPGAPDRRMAPEPDRGPQDDPDSGAARSAPTVGENDCARARKAGKACVLDVVAEDVGGTAPTASGTTIRGITYPPNGSLIRLRRDFLRELLKSAEDM